MGLSFRVRNGTGRFPHAMTAVTLVPVTNPVGVVWENLCGYNIVVLLFSCVGSCQGPRAGVVGWEPHSGRKQSLYLSVWCKLLAY